MEKKIVFFDLDGTLLNEEKKLLESTKRAVRLLQKNGIYTAIATGRIPTQFDWIRKELNINSYVCINGQYVVFEGKEIYSNPIDPLLLDDIASVVEKNGDALAYCNHEYVKSSTGNNQHIATSFQNLLSVYPEVDREFYKHSPVYQGHLYCEIDDEQFYSERYPQFSFVKWDRNAADFLPKGCSKATGIHKLLEAVQIKNENCYAFGDGLNDVEMLSSVGTGIAMGNAVPEVKAVAKHVTTSNLNDGILNGLISVGLLEKVEI